jgi:hypothetical protein
MRAGFSLALVTPLNRLTFRLEVVSDEQDSSGLPHSVFSHTAAHAAGKIRIGVPELNQGVALPAYQSLILWWPVPVLTWESKSPVEPSFDAEESTVLSAASHIFAIAKM